MSFAEAASIVLTEFRQIAFYKPTLPSFVLNIQHMFDLGTFTLISSKINLVCGKVLGGCWAGQATMVTRSKKTLMKL